MNARICIRTMLLMIAVLTLVAAMGCSKKKISEMPRGATAAKREGQMDQERIQAQERARQEAIRQRQLEEEMRIRAERERAAMAEAETQAEAQAQAAAMEVIAAMIHFDFDSYELKPDARELLQEKAQVLKSFPDVELVIEGYCDNRGTEEYNLALGERRARAAYEFLVLLGVAPDRLSIVSYGEENPLDPRNNEVAWAKNRRDEFKIVN